MSSMSIDFYDTTDPVDVPQDDPDLEFLAPAGVLRLPPLVEKPQHAPVHAGDLLTVARFVESFRSELKLPKGGLNELQVSGTCRGWCLHAARQCAQD
jgi:hypothetical protein